MPDSRFNADQVQMLFAIDCKRTDEIKDKKQGKRNHHVWVTNSGPGLEKRQCTLQICISTERSVSVLNFKEWIREFQVTPRCLGGYQVQSRVNTKHTESREFF